MGKVIIMTGPVRSGKTTKLGVLTADRHDVAGILTPDIEGQRVFLHLPEKTVFPMLASASEGSAIAVGKFIFSAAAFEKANKMLLDDLSKNPKYLIIDEIGYLELENKGFYQILTKVLPDINDHPFDLILIVRDFLVLKVKEYFGIKHAEIRNGSPGQLDEL